MNKTWGTTLKAVAANETSQPDKSCSLSMPAEKTLKTQEWRQMPSWVSQELPEPEGQISQHRIKHSNSEGRQTFLFYFLSLISWPQVSPQRQRGYLSNYFLLHFVQTSPSCPCLEKRCYPWLEESQITINYMSASSLPPILSLYCKKTKY